MFSSRMVVSSLEFVNIVNRLATLAGDFYDTVEEIDTCMSEMEYSEKCDVTDADDDGDDTATQLIDTLHESEVHAADTLAKFDELLVRLIAAREKLNTL